MSGLFDCIWLFIKKPLKNDLGALSYVKTSDWDHVMDKEITSTAGHSGHCPVSYFSNNMTFSKLQRKFNIL